MQDMQSLTSGLRNTLRNSEPVHIPLEEIIATTWECVKGETGDYKGRPFVYQGCGLIAPHQFGGRATRKSCACEQDARKRHEEAERRAEWERTQIKWTYGWLGDRWDDSVLATKTFANFEGKRQPLAYEAVQAFAETLEGTLILHGIYGTGKTHLLAALANFLRTREQKPIGAHFMTAPKFFSAIGERMSYNEQYTALVAAAIRSPLLIIDDLDKAKRTEFREEIWFEVIDERTKHGRPIAISTNRLSDLGDFVGGACVSRLSIGQVEIEMTGDDYRKGM